uniref:Uncharacterized protein n=1 Tax=Plectus sambesii TaxID=2011161 RepID=A0A914WVK8_9BILA
MFIANLLGHIGQTAVFPCLFCLILNTATLQDYQKSYLDRTIEISRFAISCWKKALEQSCHHFATDFRRFFLTESVTPKIHFLVVYLPQFAKGHKTLGYNAARNSYNNARYPPRAPQYRNNRPRVSDEQRRENRDFKAQKERERQEKLWHNHVRDADGNRPSRPNAGNYQFDRRIDTRPYCTWCKQIGHLEVFCNNHLPPADLLPPQSAAYRRESRVNVVSPAPTCKKLPQIPTTNTSPFSQSISNSGVVPFVAEAQPSQIGNNSAHLLEQLSQADARIKGLLAQNDRLVNKTHSPYATVVLHRPAGEERQTNTQPVAQGGQSGRTSVSSFGILSPSAISCATSAPYTEAMEVDEETPTQWNTIAKSPNHEGGYDSWSESSSIVNMAMRSVEIASADAKKTERAIRAALQQCALSSQPCGWPEL